MEDPTKYFTCYGMAPGAEGAIATGKTWPLPECMVDQRDKVEPDRDRCFSVASHDFQHLVSILVGFIVLVCLALRWKRRRSEAKARKQELRLIEVGLLHPESIELETSSSERNHYCQLTRDEEGRYTGQEQVQVCAAATSSNSNSDNSGAASGTVTTSYNLESPLIDQ